MVFDIHCANAWTTQMKLWSKYLFFAPKWTLKTECIKLKYFRSLTEGHVNATAWMDSEWIALNKISIVSVWMLIFAGKTGHVLQLFEAVKPMTSAAKSIQGSIYPSEAPDKEATAQVE